MAEIPKIVLPHGGYKKLIVYRKSDVIYEGTVVFCRRFLPPRGDRTVDQMIQAARSCKQNIAEGSSASGTSKETELKLAKMIERQKADFKRLGGVRERMHAARTAARGEEFEKGLYSHLAAAKSAEDLAAKAAALRRKIDQTVWSLRRKNGWEG